MVNHKDTDLKEHLNGGGLEGALSDANNEDEASDESSGLDEEDLDETLSKTQDLMKEDHTVALFKEKPEHETKMERSWDNRKREHQHSFNELIAMYEHEGDWDDDDDDEDDADWEPVQDMKIQCNWFCTNCTLKNHDERLHCALCGEHRQSGVLNQGHLASALQPREDYTSIETNRIAETSTGAKDDTVPCQQRTIVGFDDRMFLHCETAMKLNPHPERPDRLRSIVEGLAASALFPGRCSSLHAREITRAELELVHTREHIDAVEETVHNESSYFTSDTYANKHSALSARVAAGICADLAKAIVRGDADNGFALVRPPGHHAEGGTAMGFCLHNNAGIAAKVAQSIGAKKVLIVDWDVHHGNGTQAIFDHDPSVLYISLHRHDGGLFYPGTGSSNEVGSGPGEGFSVNIPWGCAGIGDNDYLLAFIHIVLPIAGEFEPDITIVSAGFDAALGDPLGGCQVTPSGFSFMTKLLTMVSQGKLLLILEGGYNLRSISSSVTAVIEVLLGDDPGPLPVDLSPSEAGAAAMFEVLSVHSKYWKQLIIPSFLKKNLVHDSSNCSMKGVSSNGNFKEKRHKKRRYVGMPLWWKWRRHELVYKHWFRAISRKKKHSHHCK